jgi:ribokinase
MTTILNPAPADRRILDPKLLSCVDLLTPNQEEAATLSSRASETIDEAESAARELLKLGMRTVIVTLGDRGCLIVEGEHSVHVPGFTVETVDTVGAGDAFNGVLALALAEGLPLPEAARWANAAGALAVTKAGAQGALPRRDEIERLMNG